MSFISSLKKLFGGRKEEIKEETVSLDNLINFMKEKNREEIKEIEDESKRFREKIRSGFKELSKMLDDFKKIEARDDLSKASVAAKNNFCDRAINILSKMPPVTSDEFVGEAYKIIDEINNTTPRQMMHMDFFFRDNVEKIVSKIKEIKQTLDEYQEFLSTNILSDIEKLRHEISSVKKSESKIGYIEMNIKSIENDLNELKEREQKQSENIPYVDREKINELKRELNEITESKKELEQRIETSFGGIKKLLKKFAYDVKDKHRQNLINSYIASSSNSFFVKDKGLEIKEILKEIKSLIEDKKIEADEKRYERVCLILSDFPFFEKLKNDYCMTNEKIAAKEREIKKEEKFMERVKKSKAELKSIRDKIAELKKMKSQLEESKSKVINEIKDKKKEIEFMVSGILDSKIRIS
ncbi:MAG: hypothetical protein J7J38_00900 [Candidatus Aenigmarchaeota archaeon]|nr:hypothetical protein [Candidatus Aenigmarchaeota archaeon]